jgi:hypothetical protein
MSAFSFNVFGPAPAPISAPTKRSRFDNADDVYARLMGPKLSMKGYPIRDAKPFVDGAGAVHEAGIGDVCYLDDGCLRRLWNIIWPEGDPPECSPDADVCPPLRDVFPQFYVGSWLSSRIGPREPHLGPALLESKGATKQETGGGISA